MAASEKVIEHFKLQRHWCGELGSTFCALILDWMVHELQSEGTLTDLVGAWDGAPNEDALSLRLLGALHHLVLTGEEPRLASFYPAGAAFGNDSDFQAEIFTVIDRQVPHLQSFLTQAVQTNEIGRSAVLLAAFSTLAGLTDRPFHMREIGASAGLNTMWDRFGYTYSNGQSWGDANSAVQLTCDLTGPAFVQHRLPEIASRACCDINPLDLTDPVIRLRVKSYIWPDMAERHRRFDAAVQMATELDVRPEQADAAQWVATQLARRPADGCFVLYHSIMWQYMPIDTRRAIANAIKDAGAKATSANPIAWIRLEPDHKSFIPELRLQFWDDRPEPINQRLAWCHPHGATMEWLMEG